jgi:iron complex outermembrane recepter protein
VRIHLTGFSVCVVLLSCLITSTIHAQSEDVIETREVVVSSTRLPDAPVDARTLPAKVTIITAEDIRKSGAKTVQEAIQWATGVVMYDQLGNAFQQTIDLRGFSGAPVPATSVFVDGVRINEPDFNAVNFDLVPLETIERIEILPNSSAIFGKNALGGAISIITKRGGGNQSVSGETLYGSFNRERSTISTSGPIGKFDYFSSFSRESEDGYRRDTSANISRFFGKLGYHQDDKTDVTVSYAYVNDKLFQAGQLTLAQMAQDRRQNLIPGSFLENESSFIRVNARQQFQWGLSLTANLFYRKLTQDSLVNFGGGFTNTAVIQTDSRGGVLQLGHEWDGWGLKNSLVIGGEFTRNDFNGTSVGFASSRSMTDEDIFALYTQDTIHVTPKLSFIGGVRYDHDQIGFTEILNTRPDGNVRFGGITPRGGVTYLVTPLTSVYFTYSQGFRVPTALEMFAFAPFTPNANLHPARSQTYEIGVKGKLIDRIDYALAAFHTAVRNEIQFTCILCTGAFGDGINRNIDQTRRQGLEGTLKTKLTEYTGLELNYTYIQAQFRRMEVFSDSNIADTGDSIPLVPKHRLSVMGHLYPAPGWAVSLIGLYVGTQFAQGDEANAFERIPGYFVLNGRISYETKAPGGKLTAYLLLNNLTDHEYSTFGTASQFGRTFVPAQSISLFGGLSYRFEGL